MAGIAELNMNWYFKKRISFFVLVYYLQSSWQRIKSYPTVCFFSSSQTTWAKAVWAKTYFLRKSNTHSKENLMMFFIVLVSMPPSIYTVFWYSCMFAEKISTRIPTIPAWPWLYVILNKCMQFINQSCLKPTSGQIGSFRWFLNRSQYFCEQMFWSICNFCDCQPVADFCKPATCNLLLNRPAPTSADLLLIFATGKNFFCRFSVGDFSGLD